MATGEAGPPPDRPRRRPGPSSAAAILAGAGVAYVVGRDGTPAWQLARVAAVVALTAVVVAAARWPDPGRATVRLGAGVAATAVGVGIALPHLTKLGLTATSIAGLAVLLGGLVLVVEAAAGLLRWASSWWLRVPLYGAVAVALLLGLVTLGQAAAVTNVPRTDVGSDTPADRGLPFEDVRFTTDDGVSLSGWYIPSDHGGAVALLHGAGSTRSNVLDHAVVLARHGYGVLLFDARGHGDSGGRAMDFGWYGERDTAAAVTYLLGRDDVDDGAVAAVGLSMGGEEAIGALGADPRLRAVVAEGAEGRVAADKAWLSDEYGVAGWLQEQVDRATYALTDALTSADPPATLRRSVARAAPRPVLLVAAGDEPDEGRAGRHIRAGSPATVDLWVVPGSGHTDALDTAREEWEERVVSFLDDALRR